MTEQQNTLKLYLLTDAQLKPTRPSRSLVKWTPESFYMNLKVFDMFSAFLGSF